MPLFRIKKDKKIDQVKEKPFDIEKELQGITEENLNEIFGLEFIKSEFNPTNSNLFFDTLAYNPETKSFVIIEYKRDKSFSVIDQGFSYLSSALNNKDSLILEYARKTRNDVDDIKIDWSQTKIMFLARNFTKYQEGAIGFKDLPIELWEVTRYNNGSVFYNKIETSERSDSISKFSKDEDISTVAEEVKNYTEEDHLNKNRKGTKLYKQIKEKILLIDPDLNIHVTQSYISFRVPDDWRNIFNVFIQNNKVKIDLLRSKPVQFKDPENKIVYREGSLDHWGQHISTIEVRNEKDVNYTIFIIKQLYERFTNEIS